MKELRAIELEINSKCNRICSYCPNVDQDRIEQGSMSKELFHTILVQLKEIEYSGRISFSFYNEPLLSKDLEYFATQVKIFLPHSKLLIYTNGTLLTKSKLMKLVSSGVDYLVVTKHEDEKNFIFDQVYNDLPADFKMKYVKYQSYRDLKLTNRGGLIPSVTKEFDTTILPCLIPLHMLLITNQGTILPCTDDYHQTNSMGNVKNNTINEIWNSHAYVTLRKKLAMGRRSDFETCSKCNRTEVLNIY